MQARGWSITVDKPDEVAVERSAAVEWGDGGAPCLTFVPVADARVGKNRVHLDLASASAGHQREIVARLTELGAEASGWPVTQAPGVASLRDPAGTRR